MEGEPGFRTGPRPGWRPVMGALLLAVAGCRSAAPVATAPAPCWPPSPAPARVQFVQSVGAPADLGIKPSVPARTLNLLTGGNRGAEPWGTPFAVAIGEQGDWCFTDTTYNEVVGVDAARRRLWRWDHVGTNVLLAPVGVAYLGDRVIVADSALRRVLIADREGQLCGEVAGPFQRPVAVAVRGGRIVVVDSGACRVSVHAESGERLLTFGRGGSGDGEFNRPTHVAIDSSGRLFVADSLNNRVQVFDAAGRFLRAFGGNGDSSGHFGRPKGVAVDDDGQVYVMDGLFAMLQIFDARGRLLLDLGGPGQAEGEFWLPAGIAVSGDGRLVVADAYNHRLQWFRMLAAPPRSGTGAAPAGAQGGVP